MLVLEFGVLLHLFQNEGRISNRDANVPIPPIQAEEEENTSLGNRDEEDEIVR